MSSAHAALTICCFCGSAIDGHGAFAFLSLTEL